MEASDSERTVIRKFSTQAQANVIIALLEGAGIKCYLDNKALSDLFPDNPMNVDKLELSVQNKDAKLAEEILNAKFDKRDMR